MKKSTKTIIVSIALCFIFSLGVFCVFATKNFSLRSGGVIEFVAPGMNATISSATLNGMTKKADSAQMNEFTISPTMTTSQIEALSGYQSWSGIKLLFDEEADGSATLSFTITNNSTKSIENIMVELSTNTTNESPIQVTPSADFCINPNSSHTFTIGFNVADSASSSKLNDFKITVVLKMIKPDEVLTAEEQKAENGLNFELDSTTSTALFAKYTTPTSETSTVDGTSIDIPAIVKDESDNLYTVIGTKNGTSLAPLVSSLSLKLASLTFPSTLTSIGDYAFGKCKKLTGDLTLPNGIKTIGGAAFSSCGFTGNLTLPSSIVSIEGSAFSGCKFTGKLILPSGLKTIGGNAFYSGAFTGTLTIPSATTTIGEGAFGTCKNIDSVAVNGGNYAYYAKNNCLISKQDKMLMWGGKNSTIPQDENILKIGAYAFYENTAITGELIIPNTVTTIGGYAFYGCTSLTGNLVIPNNVTTIGSHAFYGCSGFNGNLVIPNNVTTIDSYSFYGCSGFNGDLIIPDSVTEIGRYIFYNCSGLTGDLIIPDSVTVIGDSAFYNCSGFTGDLIIPDNVITIGSNAFYNCSGLTGNLTIGASVTKIDTYAFKKCSKLTGNLIIPNSVIEIRYEAFYGCSGFNGNLTIGANVADIGEEAFRDCSGLTGDLIIPDSVTVMDDFAFAYCSGFNGNLIIGNGLVEVSWRAFSGCSGFVSVVIGSGVQTIDTYAFENCSGLESITINRATPPSLGSYNFDSVKSTCQIYVPVGSVETYKASTKWSPYASKIVAIGS